MQLNTAAYGWEGEVWSSSYPDDLPVEWRLEYYANQYAAVVVPHHQWRGRDSDGLRQWLEDTPEAFRFYWEVETAEECRRLLELYASQDGGRRPGGWLFLSATGGEGPLLQELEALAPVSQCVEPAQCQASGFQVMAVAPAEALRPLRQRIDTLAEEGVESLLLVVMPAVEAEAQLQQLHTLSLLYSG